MSSTTKIRIKKTPMKSNALQEVLWTVLLLSTGAVTYILYSQFFSSGWTFDDTRILKGLADVTDIRSAVNFIQSDKYISLLNRPLSVASFLLNVNDWPANINGFRHVNTLMHIFNGFLLFLFSLRIVQIIPPLKSKQTGFAVTLSMLWMLHPFFVSTSYHIIQRMVLLAATFSLLGGIVYLHGRRLLERAPGRAYLWMSLGLVIAGGVGSLAKENAALAPLLIGVLEFTILSFYVPVKQKYLTSWRSIFFGTPVLLLLAYVLHYFVVAGAPGYEQRTFTLGDRLFSESLIMLMYVKQILVPNTSLMGPFQDDTAYVHGVGFITVVSSLFWVCLTGVAVYVRKKQSVFSMAVLFFVTGHLLESTVFPLELYFEHRNYIPSLGILGAIVALAWGGRASWPRAILMVYIGLIGVLLWQTTTLWGDKYEISHRWMKTHPTSFRAVMNLANFYQGTGQTEAAAEVLYQGYIRMPMDGSLSVTIFSSQCFRGGQDKFIQLIDEVISKAPNLNFNPDTASVLHGIIDTYVQGKCKGFDATQLIDFADGLMSNPKYETKAQKSTLLFAKARAMDTMGEYQSALKYKIEAFQTLSILAVAKVIYGSFLKIGQYEDANIFLNEVRQKLPEFSTEYALWEKNQTQFKRRNE